MKKLILKWKLKEQGKTITLLAKEIGISISYCSDVIRGNRQGTRVKEKIKEILKI